MSTFFCAERCGPITHLCPICGRDNGDRMERAFSDAMKIADQRDEARAELAKAKRFKAYVHGRLDSEGVPLDPQPEGTAAHGCRIEGRLDWMSDERDTLRKDLARALELKAGAEAQAEHFLAQRLAMTHELDKLRIALERLASTVSFTVAFDAKFAAASTLWAELRARGEFATAALQGKKPG